MTDSPENHRAPDGIVGSAEAVRGSSPLVHCLTNAVVKEITANVLLAVGASPAMVEHPDEARIFAGMADGVLVNVGTVSEDQIAAIQAAVETAGSAGVPWVLDPVAVGGLPLRTEFARDLVTQRPTAIRGNASEIVALAGQGSGGRGVESTDAVETALDAARFLAERTGGIVAISGERDVVVSANRTTWLTSGHEFMPLVIGTGCSLGATVAAYLGAARAAGLADHDAVLAAHAHVGAAGSLAGRTADGPGSFHVRWIDSLYELSPAGIGRLVEVHEEAQ
ncbi:MULTISPECIES: hydroxyethylthiazole kinase [Micrococcaceae]|uniref:hydroxyethylthiazole kinase n=1 Tax=unclassified Kocuria TaxID=2649579 RepID=UPI0010100C32|nr:MULTISPECIES: hydroxyethylthiazole kinase [unclassified Kocuria]